jgi:hypothetical protein
LTIIILLKGGIEGLREKLDAEIARSMIAKEHYAIVETEMERLGAEDVPPLPGYSVFQGFS